MARGIDLFDCVMPTRNARNATLFTTEGRLNVRNATWKTDEVPIDAGLDLYHSQQFSRAYLRHLTVANEPLFMEIASAQNVGFYLWIMREMRAAILEGRFASWRHKWSDRVAQKAPLPAER